MLSEVFAIELDDEPGRAAEAVAAFTAENLNAVGVDVRAQQGRRLAGGRHCHAHRVHHHALADRIRAHLIASHHVNSVLNRTGSDQRAKMMALQIALHPRGGHDEDLRALQSLAAGHLREADLIAYEQADPPERRVDRRKKPVARLHQVGFPVAERVIQVRLVIGADDLPRGVEHHGAVVDAPVLRLRLLREAKDHPQAVRNMMLVTNKRSYVSFALQRFMEAFSIGSRLKFLK